jgi:glycyl-tRNA synthetase
VSNFTDPLSECNSCKRRVRVDKLYAEVAGATAGPLTASDGGKPSLDTYGNWLSTAGVKCPACGATGEKGLGKPRDFNLLFTTRVGPVGDAPAARSHDASTDGCGLAYLRPETAQGVYVQFNNVVTTSRAKLPFGGNDSVSRLPCFHAFGRFVILI